HMRVRARSPQLAERRAFEGERALEVHDLLVAPLPLLRRGEAIHALHQHTAVPRSVEHRHAAPAGKPGAETAQEGGPLLVGSWTPKLCPSHVAGIETAYEPLDGAALP